MSENPTLVLKKSKELCTQWMLFFLSISYPPSLPAFLADDGWRNGEPSQLASIGGHLFSLHWFSVTVWMTNRIIQSTMSNLWPLGAVDQPFSICLTLGWGSGDLKRCHHLLNSANLHALLKGAHYVPELYILTKSSPKCKCSTEIVRMVRLPFLNSLWSTALHN